MDSPGLVPSGLLEEPLEERRNGGAGGRSAPHISLSRRSGPSRLGMPAAAGEQSIARGGLPAGSAFDLIDRCVAVKLASKQRNKLTAQYDPWLPLFV